MPPARQLTFPTLPHTFAQDRGNEWIKSACWPGCKSDAVAATHPAVHGRRDAGRGLLCVAEVAVFSGEAKEGDGLTEGVTDVASG